jgi:hypothetical protein
MSKRKLAPKVKKKFRKRNRKRLHLILTIKQLIYTKGLK